MIYYELTPLDTLFFRGALPMEAGQLAAASLFPPPVSVFIGAIRTAVLHQQGISPQMYAAGKAPRVESLIGKHGEHAPFELTAVFIKKNNRYFAQAPASWYIDTLKKPIRKEDYADKKLLEAQRLSSCLDMYSSEHSLPFVKAEYEALPLSSLWIELSFLQQPKERLGEHILLNSEVYAVENRTGIGLDSNRHVLEGQLYTASHIRLLDDVSLCVGLSQETGLRPEGVVRLGGENRICRYTTNSAPITFHGDNTALYLALAPVKADESVLAHVFCAKKPVEIAGWDLQKGFHKPTESWLPAGTVFTQKCSEACIPLPSLAGGTT